MVWVRITAIRLLLIAASTRGFRAEGADSDVRAEVRRVTMTQGERVDDPEVASFSLNFDLHLTNGSRRPVRLPASHKGNTNPNSVLILGADAKGPGGAWVHLFQGSWYDNGTLTYEPCASLRPGSEGDIGDVKSGFILMKKQLPSLGKEPTIRLQITIFCRQANGRLSSKDVTTDAFRIDLPSK